MIIAAVQKMKSQRKNKNQSNKLILDLVFTPFEIYNLLSYIQFYKGISNVWLHLLKGGKN